MVTGQRPLYLLMIKKDLRIMPIYLKMLLHKFPFTGVNPRTDYKLLLEVVKVKQESIQRTTRLIQ